MQKRNKALKKAPGKGDVFFLAAVLLLAAYGVVCVYSASYYNAQVQYGDGAFFFRKQLIGYCIGAAAMVGLSFLDYEKLRRIGVPALLVSLALLALVFVPGLGKSNYGATRWIAVGPITVQPSEIAKLGFVLFAAGYFSKDPARMRTLRGCLPVLAAGIGVCLLILLEPNMSVTMCVGALMLGMLFLAGISKKALACICIPVLFAVPVLIAMEPYRLQRLSAFMDPWASPKDEGYQLIQSLYGLANGNLFGVGLVLALFLLIGFIVWRGFCIAARSGNFYGFLLAGGITLAFAVQCALNALVVSGCIPPTGLPLPLVSAGNTSLIVTMAGMGIVYGVSRHTQSERRIQ